MAILTIAREYGAISHEKEQLLRSGYRGTFLHKEWLEKMFVEHDINPKVLDKYDEKKPGFFATMFNNESDTYLQLMKLFILKGLSQGPAVVIGRGAHIFLKDLPNCLRIRLIAPINVRLKRVMEWHHCDETTAKKIILTSDDNRCGYCRFHFDADWRNPAYYDLVFNTAEVAQQEITNILDIALANRSTPDKEEAGRIMILDQMLAAQLVYEITSEKKLQVQMFDIKIQDGVATLLGAVVTRINSTRIEEIVASTPGIKSVDNRLQIIPPNVHRHIG